MAVPQGDWVFDARRKEWRAYAGVRKQLSHIISLECDEFGDTSFCLHDVLRGIYSTHRALLKAMLTARPQERAT